MEAFKKYLYWAALALFAYMPFHIFLSQWLSTFTGGLDGWKIAKDVFTVALVTVIVGAVILTRRYTRLFLILLGLTIAYMVLHGLLFVTTDQPTETGLLATVYNSRVMWYVLIGYGLALLAPRLADPKRFARVLIIVSTLVCLVGFAQWILPKDVMTNFGYSIDRGVKPNFFIDDKPDLPRVFSTVRDPNSLGAFLILPGVLILLALVRYWKTPRRVLLLGLLLLHGLVLILTFSRSAWIGVLLADALALTFVFHRTLLVALKRFAIPLAMGVVLLFGGLFMLRHQYIVQNVLLHSDESTTADDPNELRVKLFEEGLNGVAEDPEGHGPGTAGLVSTKLSKGLLTENYYLQIAYEVGIAGLAIFLAFLYFILNSIWKLRRHLVAQALLASFVGLAVINFLLHIWANEAVAAAWFLLAGVASGVKVSEK